MNYIAIPGLKYREKNLYGMLPNRIIEVVCMVTGYTQVEMYSPGGYHHKRHMRWIIMEQLRKRTTMSHKEIGKIFGYDHSTVINALKRLQVQKEKHSLINQIIQQVENNLL